MRTSRRLVRMAMFAAAYAAGGCAEPKLGAPRPVRAECPPSTDLAYFFPEGALTEQTPSNPDFSRDWDISRRAQYSSHLAVMGEPSLSCGASDADEIYRFTWLRSWHAPIAMRVERRDGVYAMMTAQLDGYGGYEPGGVVVRVETAMDGAEWAKLTAALEHAQFWSVPTIPQVDCEGLLNVIEGLPPVRDYLCVRMGTDGARWIFEGQRDGEYHVVDRYSPHFLYPESNARLFDLGMRFIGASGLDVAEQDIY